MDNTITVGSTTFTRDRLSDMLSTSMQGSTSWVGHMVRREPTTWEFTSELPLPSDKMHYAVDYPLNSGGALLIVTDDEPDKEYVLDWDAL